jgi:hypothetical protein
MTSARAVEPSGARIRAVSVMENPGRIIGPAG